MAAAGDVRTRAAGARLTLGLVLRQAQIYGYLRFFLAPGLRCSLLCGACHTASSRLARNQKSLAPTLAFLDLTEH